MRRRGHCDHTVNCDNVSVKRSSAQTHRFCCRTVIRFCGVSLSASQLSQRGLGRRSAVLPPPLLVLPPGGPDGFASGVPLVRCARRKVILVLLIGGAALLRAVAAVERAAQARMRATHASVWPQTALAGRRWSRAAAQVHARCRSTQHRGDSVVPLHEGRRSGK